jgi:glycolate oxidase FAD binding subunit
MSDAALSRLIDRVQSARAAHAPLAIRGGSTKDFYGETPHGETLAMGELRGITSYEPTELVVTARAGTPLAELEAALAEQSQCLAFEPPRFAAGGTVGGMVAAGLAGPSRAAVGGVRDYVLGATMLNGHCEVLSFGGQVMKNVAGYDVSRLLAGSLGILGPILEVSLKVLPIPPARATLRFEWTQAKALSQLNLWAGQPLPIQASAWWNDMLVLRLAGAAAAVESAQRTLGGEPIAAGTADGFWTGLRDQKDEFFATAAKAVHAGATLWRFAVTQTASPLQADGDQLIEWGGGQRWLVGTAPAETMHTLAQAAGGHATAFRGAKTGGAFTALPPVLQRMHRHLKGAFDPEHLFNPGRLYPDL